MQGFYYTRPLAAAEATALLRKVKVDPHAIEDREPGAGIDAALQSEHPKLPGNSGWLQ